MSKILLLLLVACVSGGMAEAQMNTSPSTAAVNPDMLQLGPGVNLGNMLEAPREGEWGVRLHADYLPTIRKAGFTLVRLPIRWAAHVSSAPDFIIDPIFFSRVDWIVD